MQLLPTPDIAMARTLLAEWPHATQIIGVRRLGGGFQNRNIGLTLDGPPGRGVLRLYDADPAACAKEGALLERLRRLAPDFPVPRVFHVRADSHDGSPPRLVLEYIDGVALRELVVAGEMHAVAEAARDAGRILAHIASVGFGESGFLRGDLTIDSSFGGFPATYRGLLWQLANAPLFQERAGPSLVDRVARFVDAWDGRVNASRPPVLVHGDFNSRNILVRKIDGRWRVVAVLDWEFAMSGDFLGDVGNMLRYEGADHARFEPAFSEGMREGGLTLPSDWREHARALDLIALVELAGRRDLPTTALHEILQLIERTVGA